MPLYEYKCSKCNHKFEVLTGARDKAPSKCPACGAPRPAKQFSTFAVSGGGDSDLSECGASSCDNCPGAGGSCPYGDDDY